jgi:Protein of unknown function (DUF3667)
VQFCILRNTENKSDLETKLICKNCGQEFTGNFCNQCGEEVYKKRISFKYILVHILDAFDLADGLIFTIKQLSLRPGKAVAEYIDGKRKDYYNPLKYYLLIVAIVFIIRIKFNLITPEVPAGFDLSEKQILFFKQFLEFFFKYFNLILLTGIPFISFFSFVIFKKSKYSYAENLILNLYLMGHHSFINILLSPFLLLFSAGNSQVKFLQFIFSWAYHSWAFKQFFQITTPKSFFKTLITIFLGYLSWFIILLTLMMIYVRIYLT